MRYQGLEQREGQDRVPANRATCQQTLPKGRYCARAQIQVTGRVRHGIVYGEGNSTNSSYSAGITGGAVLWTPVALHYLSPRTT